MNANWIYIDKLKNERNVLTYFRKKYKNENQRQVVINIHATTFYKLYVDGEFIGRGNAPSTPDFPTYDIWKIERTSKEFCVAVEVYSLGENTEIVTEQNKGKSGLNVEIIIENQVFVTDNSWKCIIRQDYFRDEIIDPMANRISRWSGYKEIYDTTCSIENWYKNEFDDSLWQNADIMIEAIKSYGKLICREIKTLISEEIFPQKIIEVYKNLGEIEIGEKIKIDARNPGSFPSIVYDFGKEVVGYIEVKIKGGFESNVSLFYGECLDLNRIDTFILNGKSQTLEPFNRRAFRYLKICCNSSDEIIEIEKVKLNLTHYPLEEKKLIFNDMMLQNIYDTSLYTVKLGSQQHYEDSIFREQMQWLLDARIMAQVQYECFNEYDYTYKTIKQFCRTQNEDGSIKAAGPQKCSQLLPDFCLHFIIMVKEWMDYSKKSIDEEVFLSLEKLVKWFKDNEDDNELLTIKDKNNWWCFIDWANIEKNDNVTALNCLYYQALNAYAEILKSFNKDSKNIENKVKILKDKINKMMYNEEKGLYCDCVENKIMSTNYSQATNMYAIITGVCDNPKKIVDIIFSDKFKGVIINGAFLMCLTVEALLKLGMLDLGISQIKEYWGEMLSRGATTWWETFNKKTNRSSVPYAFTKNSATYLHEYIPVSYCHGWGAGVAYTLSKYYKLINK